MKAICINDNCGIEKQDRDVNVTLATTAYIGTNCGTNALAPGKMWQFNPNPMPGVVSTTPRFVNVSLCKVYDVLFSHSQIHPHKWYHLVDDDGDLINLTHEDFTRHFKEMPEK